MSDNIHIIELTKYESPVVKEDTREAWVEYGEDNLYYDWLIGRYRKSTTNNAAINNISRLMYGRGLYALDASRRPNDFARMKAIFSAEDVRNVCFDFKLFGAGHFQVHYNEQRKVIKVYHIATNLLRPEKCNDDGDIEGFWYSDDWSDTKKYKPYRIPAFGTSKEKIEIFCIKSYSVGMKYFGKIDYEGALPYAVLEEEIAEYLINDVQNGFSGTKVINFNNGVPTEEQQNLITRKVNSKLTGAGGMKTIVAFNHDETKKTTVDDIPLNDAPEHYSYLSTECQAKILNGHTIISSMLIGITVENNGFSSNADEIEVSAKYFHNSTIKPLQDPILEAVEEILSVNNISLDLYFRRLNLLEDVEQDQQKAEEAVAFDTHLDKVLEGLGEVVSDEWELIDEREVDYDLEAELNQQLIDHFTPKKTTLEKIKEGIINLIGTGTASPNKPSNQDQEIDGFYFKVRYKYDGSESPERPFCKAMMRANKVYRKEDVDKMSSQGINMSQGHDGEPYDIFLYKGGVNCHHKWLRQTYVSASKNASIGSHKTNQISTNKAEKFGYRVRNPKEVAMMPKDMPRNGHHPDYNG